AAASGPGRPAWQPDAKPPRCGTMSNATRNALCGALCLAALVAWGTSARAEPLSDQPCRLVAPMLPAAFERCGTVTVPVNPDEPEGDAIELFVARAAAETATPAADPLLI